MAFDRRELGVIAPVALGAALLLLSITGFLGASTNLVLRLAALILASGQSGEGVRDKGVKY
jgi:hypothetical protein